MVIVFTVSMATVLRFVRERIVIVVTFGGVMELLVSFGRYKMS